MNQPPGQPRKAHRIVQNGNGAHPGPPPTPAELEGVPPSMEALGAEFEALLASNQAKFAELAKQGISPDQLYLVHRRINHLIEMISRATGPNGPRWAMVTRLEFEKEIAAELAQAGPATRLMQLAEGARYTPAMIAELARQTGHLRRA